MALVTVEKGGKDIYGVLEPEPSDFKGTLSCKEQVGITWNIGLVDMAKGES